MPPAPPTALPQLIFALHRLSPAFAIHPAAARPPPRTPSPRPSMGQDTNSAADASRKSPSPSAPQHRRGYQACDPCRKRKVKCDLGSMRSAAPPYPPAPHWIKDIGLIPKFLQVSTILAPHRVCAAVAKANDANSRQLVASAKPPRRPRTMRRLPKCFAATSG